jgi:hypothetical protein
MWDLIRMEQELLKAIRVRDDWKMKGYDTPIITYGEQLEMYEDYALRLATEIEKILKGE